VLGLELMRGLVVDILVLIPKFVSFVDRGL
jgi:hypothetical protein